MKLALLFLFAAQSVWGSEVSSFNSNAQNATGRAKTKFYIIPQLVDSCLPDHFEDTVTVNEDDFIISNPKTGSKVLEFPGCINIDAKFSVLKPFNTEVIAYAEWDWSDAPVSSLELSRIDCTNSSEQACGGVGNRCFYCDACDKLASEQEDRSGEKFVCPQNKGLYPYRDEICVNDWGDLDKDKNDIVDFLEDPKYESIVKQFENVYNAALGTIKLTFLLGYNISNARRQQQIEREKIAIARAISQMSDYQFDQYIVLASVKRGQDSWIPGGITLPSQHGIQISNTDRQILRKLYTDFEWRNVHRRSMYAEIRRRPLACVIVTFDICKNEPDFRNGLGSCV